MRQKGQAWSIDMIIAVIIFVLMISILYSVLNRENKVELVELQVEANNAIARLSNTESEECNFIEGQTINVDKLEQCYNIKDPSIIRKKLGINSKFCIYIEDKDGRVIYINDKPGIGDGELIIGPTPCGQTLQ